MASLLNLVQDPVVRVLLVTSCNISFLAAIFVLAFVDCRRFFKFSEPFEAYARFVYGCFLKPHSGGNSGTQQDALESFYKAQAAVYDKTRGSLLRGREDMLGLVASQLKHRMKDQDNGRKPIWVDVGWDGWYGLHIVEADDK